MTAWADQKRAKTAIRLGFAAALTAALAFAVVARDAAERAPRRVAGPVLPDWETKGREAHVIMVTTKDATFHVTRDPDGWRLPERGRHPVDPRTLDALARGLGALRLREAKTSDPAKYDRLGLGDPLQGGEGVQLDVQSSDGRALANLVIGRGRPGGGVYVRRPGAAKTFAAEGELPPIKDPADWLDLEFIPLDRADIAETKITPAEGPAYKLARENAEARDFTLAEPAAGWSLYTAGAGNSVGAGVVGLRFADVRPAADLKGEARARHVVKSFDGLELALAIHEEGEDRWAVLTAQGEGPAKESADKLMALVKGWAYKLQPFSGERLARPLKELAEEAKKAEPKPP